MGWTTRILMAPQTSERTAVTAVFVAALLGACDDAGAPLSGSDAGEIEDATQTSPLDARNSDPAGLPKGPRYASEIEPVRSVDEALPGVFIPPYVDCRDPQGSDGAGQVAGGKVCTPVAISGCTEPGRYYPDYASCDVVRRQRPYWPAPPTGTADSSDPRLQDADYMRELEWAKQQVAASGCTCCHDSRVVSPSQWDISAEPVWIDTLSDTGLALFAGLANSVVLGAYAPEDNFGFSRDVTGIPTTDPARMQAFMLAELERRGLSESWAEGVPPFGGPIYTNSIQEPSVCGAGEGVDPDGSVRWRGNDARYVYVQHEDAQNPGVPPDQDKPEGTVWRLDVRASEPALPSGVPYGTTPAGAFQSLPAAEPAPALTSGTRYKLVVLQDVGVPILNCIFTYGDPVGDPPSPEAGAPTAPDTGVADAGFADAGDTADAGESPISTMCELPGGDERGFGAPCSDTTHHSDCPCEANYCSKSPFDAEGYCSKAVPSCDQTEDCPSDWGCIDVSVFQPGAPVLCSRP